MKPKRKDGMDPFIAFSHPMIPRGASVVHECSVDRLRAQSVRTAFQSLVIENKNFIDTCEQH